MDRKTAAANCALHYVVAAAADKRPLANNWRYCPASAEEVGAARVDPALLIGHVPYAAGLLVVDIDTGKDRPVCYWRDFVVDRLGAPLCEVPTRSGGLHLYYRCDQPVGNRSWEGGEIRCAAGYAVLWDEDAVLAALEGLQDADLVDVSTWPQVPASLNSEAFQTHCGRRVMVRSALIP